ncbi:MAG: hypothetical protein HOV80_07930 [Polyangiaceae bacterium]|nr:hypothetical protein [Polyangiaceae bacterium]
MKTRKDFRITIKATNVGKETTDTGRHQMSFSTGVEGGGRTLGLAFGNGHRAKEWSALPPGETVEESRSMGESIFRKPGDYTIQIEADGGAASCAVHVD